MTPIKARPKDGRYEEQAVKSRELGGIQCLSEEHSLQKSQRSVYVAIDSSLSNRQAAGREFVNKRVDASYRYVVLV